MGVSRQFHEQDNRYLFWTSVDTDAVGAGKKIPVIVSSANGGFYISKTITATRSNKVKSYVAIADHINSYSSFQTYTTGERYETLTEAYSAYKKQVNDNAEFTEYKTHCRSDAIFSVEFSVFAPESCKWRTKSV